MNFTQSVVLAAVATVITSLAPAAQAQSSVEWHQINGSFRVQATRGGTPNAPLCVHGLSCNCPGQPNYCGAHSNGTKVLFWKDGCARPPMQIQCVVRTAGAPPPQAAPKIVQPQARQVEPPSTGPGCPRQGTRSPRSNARAKVTFLNTNAGGTISINWIDFDGNWVNYASVARGRQFDSNSFVGHAWVVLDANGRCIGTPVVSSGSPTFAY